MNANRALWEKGDFTRIAEMVRGSGEALVAGLGLDNVRFQPGLRAELEELFEAQNEAAQGTSITATFLLVNVSRP
ncbi:MAG: hypothetical protein JWO14_2312 [Solirubrobacterales bacterium]|nr:hypothetical protein [Solirubrobacterales bacterium]